MAEKEPVVMPPAPTDNTESKPLRVRRGRVESVDLYEIKDSELDLLEKGSPADLQLNFSIFLLSLAVSGICSLATATFFSDTIKSLFMIVTVVGLILGAYLIISWWRNHQSLKTLCSRIRSRIPPEPVNVSSIQSSPNESPEEEE
ncbi:MAG TPA: hypothetical protein PLB55_04775 [Prosthecobacter sp.]|nr:hypothetical protein [Prosthecobacter sp.]